MIVSACLFILGYATTWAPGVWIIVGETFATRTRAKQGALATASNWFWNFMLAFFTPFIVKAIGFAYGFVFAGCNLFGAIVVWLFLYESSDLTLEAVDEMYNDPSCKPWSSRQWRNHIAGTVKHEESLHDHISEKVYSQAQAEGGAVPAGNGQPEV
ncbi:hypothetical protein PM082_018925 [Marasmius tenuissimus]|nr:hypothetical protein PM082_018925 [Marasmius tenuissimus]